MLTVWYNSVHIVFKIMLLLVIHMSGVPFPNLKLTYTPPRAKYEWKDLPYHAYTFVEFLQMSIL
jgi:hypothetical protein